MNWSTIEFKIREFCKNDYASLAEVHNAVYPDHPLTANELERDDADRGNECKCERWVATIESRIGAHGGFCQWPDTYKDGEYTLIGGVIPEYRNLGIGSSLFRIVLDKLRELGALKVRSHSLADREHSIRFLRQRGFEEFMRERDWELDVQDFDETPYREIIQKLNRTGITIYSFKELENDQTRDRKLYELVHQLLADTPGAEMHHRLPFDQWIDLNLDRPEIPADGYFIAVDGEQYIGKSHFETEETDDTLLTRLTGVIQSHRRKGVALALKVKGIEWARLNGYPKILTDNESNNAPMLKLNERLGFQKLPEWIFYEKRLDGESTMKQG